MAVGQGTEAKAAQEHAEQPRAKDRCQLHAIDVPVVNQFGSDVADGGSVETVQ